MTNKHFTTHNNRSMAPLCVAQQELRWQNTLHQPTLVSSISTIASNSSSGYTLTDANQEGRPNGNASQ